jgi:hypothetical protein
MIYRLFSRVKARRRFRFGVSLDLFKDADVNPMDECIRPNFPVDLWLHSIRIPRCSEQLGPIIHSNQPELSPM